MNLRLPNRTETVLLLVIFSLISVGSLLLYFVFNSHIRGQYFSLQIEDVALEFPVNWLTSSWEATNRSGTTHFVVFRPLNLQANIVVTTLDENASIDYFTNNNLTNDSSAVKFEIQRIYEWSLEQNANATISYISNGSVNLNGHEASFSEARIIGGYKDSEGGVYNLTSSVISCTYNDRILQISFFGKESDYDLINDSFLYILSSIRIQ